MNPLRIYVADLTHVGNGIATESIPLNIGLVASYARKTFGSDVEIQLFKYPDILREAILDRPPHILACSNYAWNSNLSYYFCKWAKFISPDVFTVFGGPNYPFQPDREEEFLKARPAVDIHVFQHGERSFCEVISRVLSARTRSAVLAEPLRGCQFIDPGGNEFLNGSPLPRIRDLDSIPSPYVTGLLDKFFDGQLTPLVQTSRGCPFSCNFCNAADEYFNKVDAFSDDYVRDELTYIAKHASEIGVGHLTFGDSNFGMLARDVNIAVFLNELRGKYGWPCSLSVPLGKSPKERVIRTTRMLGDLVSVSMTVQSMDDGVLAYVRRKNLPMDAHRKLMDDLDKEGRSTYAEVILPLPGETFGSYIKGVNALLDLNVTRVISHTLQMNYGTPYKDDSHFREEHGYITKYRIVPLDFSCMDGQYVFDVEEVAVSSNTMSFEEYVEARKYQLVIDLCCNSKVFDVLRKYLLSKDIKQSEWIRRTYGKSALCSAKVGRVFKSFEGETKSELWNSERELIAFYSTGENYAKLLSYERGGNVLYKHRIFMFSECIEEWIDVVFESAEELLFEGATGEARGGIKEELQEIREFVTCMSSGCLSPMALERPIIREFSHDILAWERIPGRTPLSEFAVTPPIAVRFHFPKKSVSVMQDAFKRYGTDLAGLVKMMQRVKTSAYTRQVRHEVEVESGATT